MSKKHDQKDITADRGESLITMGAALGAAGIGAAALVGATCPLCIIGAPALIGAGLWKRCQTKADQKREGSEDD